MMRLRRASERGHFDHGWLKTYHTFSFGRYVDRQHMGFRSLRVINEDWVQAGQGFGTHPHEDMEIITYVLEGSLAHRDGLGTGSAIQPGELQRMTAGTGITHSEFNPSSTEPVHLYQIWLLPESDGLPPSYEQTAFPESDRRNELKLVASPGGLDGSLAIRQDARLYLGALDDGVELTHEIATGRHAWVQVLRGEVQVGAERLAAGDAAAISDEASLTVRGLNHAEVMVFDLA